MVIMVFKISKTRDNVDSYFSNNKLRHNTQ